LTLLLLGIFAALALGADLVAGMFQSSLLHGETKLPDLSIVTYTASHRVPLLTAMMAFITDLGDELYLWVAVLSGGLVLRWFTGSWKPLLLLLVTMAGAILLSRTIKLAILRPRPPMHFWAVPASGWSFPSGHATESAAVYTALASLLAKTCETQVIKNLIWTAGLTIPFFVGISRVYLGVHWPSDVVSGWAIGIIWSMLVLAAGIVIQQASERLEGSSSIRTTKIVRN
jgi:undecaprenyl-diphosphatase